MVDAWRAVCTTRNIQGAWAKTGLFPFNLQKVLDNPLVRQSTQNDVIPAQRGIQINGLMISSPAKRLEIAQHYYQNPNLRTIPVRNQRDIFSYLSQGEERIFSLNAEINQIFSYQDSFQIFACNHFNDQNALLLTQ